MPRRKHLPYEQARLISRSLNLKSYKEWLSYSKSGVKPDNIPASARHYYIGRGWSGVRDWLGLEYRSFEDARTFARSLGLAGLREWKKYSRSGARPSDIPGSPDSQYKDQGWAGIRDWLGVPPRYRPFEDARSYVWALGIKSQTEWSRYCKFGGCPSDIPATPHGVYKHQGWIGWGDWLGTGYVSTRKRNFWLYEDAKAFVRELGIKTKREWDKYGRSGERPTYIPGNPYYVYKDEIPGWAGYGDWLGTGTIAHRKRRWRPFREARAFVRSLNLTVGWRESHYRPVRSRRGINLTVVWREYCKSGERPVNIPTDPARVYKDKGWAGMRDWLGK